MRRSRVNVTDMDCLSICSFRVIFRFQNAPVALLSLLLKEKKSVYNMLCNISCSFVAAVTPC